jgi:hypothetical protein
MSEMEDIFQPGTHTGRVAGARLGELVLFAVRTGDGKQ